MSDLRAFSSKRNVQSLASTRLGSGSSASVWKSPRKCRVLVCVWLLGLNSFGPCNVGLLGARGHIEGGVIDVTDARSHARGLSWPGITQAGNAQAGEEHNAVVDPHARLAILARAESGNDYRAAATQAASGVQPKPPVSWPSDALIETPLPHLDNIIRRAGVTLDRPFLLLGILSSRRTFRRRVTVRNTWLRFITHEPCQSVVAKFVLSRDEAPARADGAAEEENILYVEDSVTYSSILIKVFVMLEHAAAIRARWVLKTDDDAYINVPQALHNLLALCKSAECDDSRAYVGMFIGGADVMMDARHKWHNQPYIAHASVKQYLPYALGGGYILSSDLFTVLVRLHHAVRLLFTPIEDATVGMWLAGMNVTRINWTGAIYAYGWTCCFVRSMDRNVRNDVLGRYSLSADPCKANKVEYGMYQTESLKGLLERARRAQAAEVGATTVDIALPEHQNAEVVSTGDGASEDQWHDRAAAVGASGLGGGFRRLQAEDGQGEGGKEKKASSWYSRPIILHKIANPLHLHYLHWRLQHCSIPTGDLLTPAAIANAQANMPSLASLFALQTMARGGASVA